LQQENPQEISKYNKRRKEKRKEKFTGIDPDNGRDVGKHW